MRKKTPKLNNEASKCEVCRKVLKPGDCNAWAVDGVKTCNEHTPWLKAKRKEKLR